MEKKKNKNEKLLVFLGVLIILVFGLYMSLYFYKDYRDKNPKEDISAKKIDNNKNNKTIYPKEKSKIIDVDGKKYIGYPNYKFITEVTDEDNNMNEEVKIYNIDNVFIVEGSSSPASNKYALNEDGSVTILTTYYDEDKAYDYERYDYNGYKIDSSNNYEKVAAIVDNYMLVIKDNHILLQDYKGNYVKGYDFDLSKGNYEFSYPDFGWNKIDNKEVISVGITNLDEQDETKAYILYYFDPQTNKIGTNLE